MNIPIATYRLQFHKEFGFQRVGGILDYLKALGVSHIYASPIFKARVGSAHGYDIVDPNRLNPELGSESDFRALNLNVKEAGLLWMQDIVPNHMAFASQNEMLMDVLECGQRSLYRDVFDIDWDHIYENMRGRVLAPFLGRFYAEALHDGEIKLEYSEQGFGIRYYELRLPIRLVSYPQILEHGLGEIEQRIGADHPDVISLIGAAHFLRAAAEYTDPLVWKEQLQFGKRMLSAAYRSSKSIKEHVERALVYFNGVPGEPDTFIPLDELLSQQFFRLSFWKVAAEEINYRRFFTINELISVRVEDAKVMNNTHQLIYRLVQEGVFDALRVDHVDGLFDPQNYLQRLREKVGNKYVVVEKIMERDEELPKWAVQGTTGYDMMNHINGLFCRPEAHKELTDAYRAFIGSTDDYDEMVCSKKRLIISKHLAGNIDNLAHMMKKVSSNDRYGRDLTLYGLKRALVEVMANFPVYRTYFTKDEVAEDGVRFVQQALQSARERFPDLLYELGFIEQFLLLGSHGSLKDEDHNELVMFIMTFQQYTAPLMAKGFEDTILYIYNPLTSLNEVGGNPAHFGMSAVDFHEIVSGRFQQTPYSMNATATHDTKRGEDVRARINVVSEVPLAWSEQVLLWSEKNFSKKTVVKGKAMPDRNDEWLLYQTIVGTLPFSGRVDKGYVDRIKQYMIKAVKEAKVHTAWIKPDTAYEEACVTFIEGILTDENLGSIGMVPFAQEVAYYGVFNALSQTLLKFACPGVPDIYQGCEQWDLHLVDPDNRTPVHYKKYWEDLQYLKKREQEDRAGLLRELWQERSNGRIKQYLVHKLLLVRGEYESLFRDGEYIPLIVKGRRENIVSFARHWEGRWCIAVVPRFLTHVLRLDDDPFQKDVWQGSSCALPEGVPRVWRHAVTGERIEVSGEMDLGDVLSRFPVALLVGE